MTNEIEQIKKLFPKITQGEWEAGCQEIIAGGDYIFDVWLSDCSSIQDSYNIYFVCLLRNNIESILAENERLREALEDIKNKGEDKLFKVVATAFRGHEEVIKVMTDIARTALHPKETEEK